MALIQRAPAPIADVGEASKGPPKIQPKLFERLQDNEKASFWVRFEDRADLSSASRGEDWNERGRAVYDALTKTAKSSQARVRAVLDAARVDYTPFWVSNAIYVRQGSLDLARSLAADPEVATLLPTVTYGLPDPAEAKPQQEVNAVEWNIAAINADDVWSEFGDTGSGIVIANIDTGAQYTHSALVGQYRGNLGGGFDHNYDWFDPSAVCPSAEPCDNHGHGTHTMGTMVGDDGEGNQIGVAPGARWIAAKGCETGSCSDFALVSSGQWMVAPTDLNRENPRPDLRPHIVSNSWGDANGADENPWYDDVLTAWRAAGIFPAFANGNAGPGCDTAGSPGDSLLSYSVGAYNSEGQIANFSSRGPGADNTLKPNISAPGVAVRSSVPTDGYAVFNGTSMATPHVAATVALMWSAAPSIVGDVAETEALLDQSAVDVEATSCGGAAADNNVFGEGRLDALASVRDAPRGPSGRLRGTVTDAATGAPIRGALVHVTGPVERSGFTDGQGAYSLLLSVGTYDVTVDADDYPPETRSAEVTVDATTTLDLALRSGVLAVDPTELSADVALGASTDLTVTVSNTGTADANFAITEHGDTADGDVAWLAAQPTSEQVPAGGNVNVTVTLDASQVHRPDSYRAELVFEEDTPRDLAPLPVVMTTTAPEGWGSAVGTVTGTDRCQLGSPLPGASVRVGDVEVHTDDDGGYEVWRDAGTYPITVTAAGYVAQSDDVTISAGEASTQDFQLRLDAPCPNVAPRNLEFKLPIGGTDSAELTIGNAGAGAYAFSSGERNLTRDTPSTVPLPQEAPWETVPDYPLVERASGGITADAFKGKIYSIGSSESFEDHPFPRSDDLFVFDPERNAWEQRASMTIPRRDPAGAFVGGLFYVVGGWVNWEQRDRTVTELEIYDPATDTWTTGASVPAAYGASAAVALDGKLYVIGGCEQIGPEQLCGTTDVFVYDPFADHWSEAASYPEPIAWTHCGAMNLRIYCAGGATTWHASANAYVYDPMVDAWSPIADLPMALAAGADTAANGRLIISGGLTGWYSATVERGGDPTNAGFAYDPATDTWARIPDAKVASFRGGGACGTGGFYKIGGRRKDDPGVGGGDVERLPGFDLCGGSDVSWLSLDTTQGVVDPDGTATLTVTADASGSAMQPGTHAAEVVVTGSTIPALTVPISLTVPPPDGWGKVAGTIDGLGHCDAPGSSLAGATVRVGDTAVTTNRSGEFEWWLDAGTYPVTVTADGYLSKSGEVTVTHGETTTHDVDLRVHAPCAHAAPESVELTVPFGGTEREEFTIENTGADTLGFSILERERNHDIAPAGRTSSPAGSVDTESSVEPATRSAGAPQWVAVADYPIPVAGNAAAFLNGDVYSVGGVTPDPEEGEGVLDRLYVYDPQRDAWERRASMSNPRLRPAAAFVNGLLYVVGGMGARADGEPSDEPVADLAIYDPTTDTWSSGARVPAAYAGSAPVVLDDSLYVIGGSDRFSSEDGSGPTSDVWVYDPAADTWSAVAPYPEAVLGTHCGGIDGFIYCAGGMVKLSGSGSKETAHGYVYNPAADTWTQIADLPQPLSDGGVAVSTGRLIVSGGLTEDWVGRLDYITTGSGFAYHPDSDSWTRITGSHRVSSPGTTCGYKIGGRAGVVGFFAPVPDSERLPGLYESCWDDIPWLAGAPAEGTVGPGDSADLAITADASVLDQPGTYHAVLAIGDGTPLMGDSLAVTLTVTPPKGWGKVAGTVSGLGHCDGSGLPLKAATVTIGNTAIKADRRGAFEWWLKAGTHPEAVTADGYVSDAGRVTVTSGETTTHEVELRRDAPCASVSPQSLEVTVPQDGAAHIELTLGNAGPAGYGFEIAESPLHLVRLGAANPATTGSSTAAEITHTRPETSGTPASAGGIPAESSPWSSAADLPSWRWLYGHARCDDDPSAFYVLGGVTDNPDDGRRAWRYDADNDIWAELTPPPGVTDYAATVVVCTEGKLHVMAAGNSAHHFVYDIASDTWDSAAPLPREQAMPAAVGTLAGKIYLVGGIEAGVGGTRAIDAVSVYDVATDSWIGEGSPMPVAASLSAFVQVGRYLYVLGGFRGPFADPVDVTQRYDLLADTWETGPAFERPTALGALSGTTTALYAIGGTSDGSFDRSATVERLDLSEWPQGSWEPIEPLPTGVLGNSGGFCTETASGTAIWSVGGIDEQGSGTGWNFVRPTVEEECPHVEKDVPWLSVQPTNGDVEGGTTDTVEVTVDASGLTPGEQTATLIVKTTDLGAAVIHLPITVNVTADDACPDGYSADENIVFGDQDSGVPNYDRGDGCTFLDLVWAEAPFDNHGHFVRTVRELSRKWRDEGLLTRREAQLVTTAAARSDIGNGRDRGFKTGQAAMLTPAPGWSVEPLITVGETLPGSSYRFESIPDGIALRERSNDRVDLYVNHETSTVPFPFTLSTGVGFNDFTNSLLSKLTLNRKTAGVLAGENAIPDSANYQRFCSNFMATREHGFSRPILFTGEEALDWVNRTGTAWPATVNAHEARQAGAVVAYDVERRSYRTIWGMGRYNHENSVAIPGYRSRVILSTDDTFVSNPAQSQLYSYIANSTSDVLNDKGDLWAFVSDTPGFDDYYDFAVGSTVEINGHFEKVPKDIATGRNPDGTDMISSDKGYPDPPDDGTWQRGPDSVTGLDGPQWVLEHWGDIQPKPAFQFVRLEDIAYDRRKNNVIYIADTGRGATTPGGNAFTSSNGRIWKLVLDKKDPTQAKLSILIEGDDNPVKTLGEIHQPDNLESTKNGLFVTEDPGSSQQFPFGSTAPETTTARLWHHSFATGTASVIARVDQSADEGPTDRDAATARGNLGAWESSGIVDASKTFGKGTYLIDVQAGTLIVEEEQRGTLTYQREGGQLLILREPQSQGGDDDDDD